MLDQTPVQSRADADPVPALLHHLETGNDVIRTGAVRAMAAQGRGDERVRAALLGALMDEDPDVRSDAMEALIGSARPEDADTIRRSLMGDPVREVKHAAIACLTALNDTGSVPVFRQLALSRAEQDVAWEDENDSWDDWLDIQIAVIDALGQMKITDAIQDLLAARDDEMGQTLDGPVFQALGNMGSDGAVWLLSVAQTEPGLPRKRALEALARIDSDLLLDQVDYLLADETAGVRRLALPMLPATDDRAAGLALSDPDADLRREALHRYAADLPDLPVQCLADSSETVQAAALDLLPPDLTPELQEQVAVNTLAWVTVSGPALAAAAAGVLPRYAPDQAADALMHLVRDTDRPLDARIAGVEALASLDDAAATERLITLLRNESQQVRTVALTHLAKAARSGDDVAAQALALAMGGVLLSPVQAVVDRPAEDGPDVSTPKGEGGPRPRLRISPDGEIIETDAEGMGEVTQSTLSSIQSGLELPEPDPQPLAEETPEESGAKRRKRRAVEGPDTVADNLQQQALSLAGEIPTKSIFEAVLAATEAGDDAQRQAAYRALLGRATSGDLPEQGWDRALAGLTDEHPAIRSVAAETIAVNPDCRQHLAAYQADADAIVRAVVVRACAEGDALLTCLADPVLMVRRAALDRILAENDGKQAGAAFHALHRAEQIDTLGETLQRSQAARLTACETLNRADLTIRQVHVLIQAMAQPPVPSDRQVMA